MSLTSRLATSALLAAIALSPAAALADDFGPSPALPPFYQAVMKLKPDGKLGQVLKQERISTPIPNAIAWRIAYVSSDLNGKKTISTAVVVAPKGKAPKGGRPVITWSHGTTGTAVNCGPSQVNDPARPLNLYFRVGGDSWTDYGLPALAQFIKAGYVVVGTDYQGLGSPGKHQYGVALTNGRDAINAARAVGTMKDTGAGKKVVAIGWSQGGGSTIAAAGQPEYIAQKGTARDGLDFVGFVALAPEDTSALVPGKLDAASAQKLFDDLIKTYTADSFAFAHFAMYLWAIQATYPDKLKLADLITADKIATVDEIVANKCVHPLADTFTYTFGKDATKLMRSDPQNTLAWAQAFQDINVPNDVKPIAPVVIYYGDQDNVTPPIQHELYRKNMCAIAGANVARVLLPGDQNHFSTPGVSEQFYLPWIADRLAGRPAPDGCANN
jgi:pimeloyl-ACP methyl ester carboxylesterase